MSITTFKRILRGAVFALFTLVGTVTPYARGAATLLDYREPEGAEAPSVVVRAHATWRRPMLWVTRLDSSPALLTGTFATTLAQPP